MSHKTFTISFVLAHILAASLCAFPATATLRSEASVRSGPGELFYETSRLSAGDAVQVFSISETDWCAIRPPIGSFSWVNGKTLYVGLDGIGVATTDGADVRVGSEITDQCGTIQVALQSDERVRVLDRVRVDDDAESPIWYKIAPPSGEFRYIHRDYLDVAISGMPTPRARPQPAAILPVAYEVELSVTSAPPVVPALASVAPPVIRRPFAEAYQELRDEVGLAMRQPTEDWVFETLHQQAEQLITIAPSEPERAQVQQLALALSKTQLVRKELTQRRALAQIGSPARAHAATPALTSLQSPSTSAMASPLVNPLPVTASPQTMRPVGYRAGNHATAPTTTPFVMFPSATSSAAPSAAPFAVEGTLGRFAPAPAGYPPYAVLDANQQVVCLVTPQRGVPLDTLVGKRVGLQGTLGVYKTKEGASLRHIDANVVVAVP